MYCEGYGNVIYSTSGIEICFGGAAVASGARMIRHANKPVITMPARCIEPRRPKRRRSPFTRLTGR